METEILRKFELMSPAGSWESLMAAIKAGCDAVYFGVEQLNMRARSSNNFTLEDLPGIAEITKAAGVKSYLTLNTILYDHDIQLMKSIIDTAQQSGISAIIASDHAAMFHCKKVGMPLHISTQANVSNLDTVAFFAAFADVVVLARELSLKQVAEISKGIVKQQIKGPSGSLVKLEIFAHGALCMAVSGKCYLSLHSHFASANRGACIQNCRRSYVVMDKDEGIAFEVDNEYIMSAKDLCTIGFLDQILEAGVSVLKIEGRGRSADYVFTVTQCYREAIDAFVRGEYTRELIDGWMPRLATVYNRGFWDGYYLGKKMGEWSDSYGSKATQRKIYVAKGVKYFDEAGIAEFRCESHDLNVGDKVAVTGPTTGYVEAMVSEIRKEGMSVDSVSRGDQFTIQLSEKIRPSDKLYKLVGQ